MTQQVLEETLQVWLDGMATLHINILAMHDIAAPRLQETNNVPSTLFLLKGENASLTELWQLTKQLEALPIVSSWEEVVMQIAPQEYQSLLAVVLAVSSEQWSFLQEGFHPDFYVHAR